MNASILSKFENSEKQIAGVHPEYQYLYLIRKILNEGTLEEGRNGKTQSIFGNSMRFSFYQIG